MDFGLSQLHWSGCLSVLFLLQEWDWVAYAKLDGNGEEITAGFLSNSIAARNTWEVDKCRLDNALLAVKTSEDFFGEAFSVLA